MSDDEYFGALPTGYQLAEYRIEGVLGQGGFGITYKARDTNLNKLVAIKEYLPEQFAFRKQTDTVYPRQGSADDFKWGLDRFLQEAQTLGQFEHPNIVPVLRYFSANETAYMVMAYQDGQALSEILDAVQILEESELEEVIYPLLDGLEAVHRAGVLHRDIKPDNIFIRLVDGTPVLLDFGAARQAIGARHRNVTRIVTPNYAPHEQYHSDGVLGPWTDIYALAAVVYEGITGAPPPEAPARITNDKIVPALRAGRDRYRRGFLQAIDAGLAVRHDRRPQTIAQWRKKFPPALNPEISVSPSRHGRLSSALRPGSARLAAAAAQSRRLSGGTSPTARDPMALVDSALAGIGDPGPPDTARTAKVRGAVPADGVAAEAAPWSAPPLAVGAGTPPAAPPAPPAPALRAAAGIEARPTRAQRAGSLAAPGGAVAQTRAVEPAAAPAADRRVTRQSRRGRLAPPVWLATGAVMLVVGGFGVFAVSLLPGPDRTVSIAGPGPAVDGGPSDGGPSDGVTTTAAARDDTDPDPAATIDVEAVVRDMQEQADLKRRQTVALLARLKRQREIAAAKARDEAVARAFHNRRLHVRLPGRQDQTLLVFSGNGALTGSTVLVSSSGEDVNERGRWWVEDSRLCFKLDRWNGSNSSCFRISFKGRPTESRVGVVGAGGVGNFTGTLTH